MPLYMTRRAGESFSLRDATGNRVVRVKLHHGGDEPLLSIEAPKHLRIYREDTPGEGIDGPGIREDAA